MPQIFKLKLLKSRNKKPLLYYFENFRWRETKKEKIFFGRKNILDYVPRMPCMNPINLLVIYMTKILQLSYSTSKHTTSLLFQYEPWKVRVPVNEQNIWMATEDLGRMCKAKSVIQRCMTHLGTDQNTSKTYRQEIFLSFDIISTSWTKPEIQICIHLRI